MKQKFELHLHCQTPDSEITNRLTAIESKLDALLAVSQNLEEDIQMLQDQLTDLAAKTDALGVAVAEVAQAQTDNNTALDAEIVDIKAALAQLTQDNPQLATALAAIGTSVTNIGSIAANTTANTDKIKNILIAAPIVPSVTQGNTRR